MFFSGSEAMITVISAAKVAADATRSCNAMIQKTAEVWTHGGK